MEGVHAADQDRRVEAGRCVHAGTDDPGCDPDRAQFVDRLPDQLAARDTHDYGPWGLAARGQLAVRQRGENHGLACPSGQSEQGRVPAGVPCGLDRLDGIHLIRPQDGCMAVAPEPGGHTAPRLRGTVASLLASRPGSTTTVRPWDPSPSVDSLLTLALTLIVSAQRYATDRPALAGRSLSDDRGRR